MSEIPVGRIEFSLCGKRYELSGPDIKVSPPVSAAALIKAANAEGAKLERQRIRAKVEEMLVTAEFTEELDKLLRWLDGEDA